MRREPDDPRREKTSRVSLDNDIVRSSSGLHAPASNDRSSVRAPRQPRGYGEKYDEIICAIRAKKIKVSMSYYNLHVVEVHLSRTSKDCFVPSRG